MLLPARVECNWFQENIFGHREEVNAIYVLKGRLRFVNPLLNKKMDPHIIGSLLWILSGNDRNIDWDQIVDLKTHLPGIFIK
jgi:hypothetical protein